MAEEAGAAVLRGRAARALEGRCVRLDDGEEMEADALFLATGKHELRGAAREIGERPVSVGLRAALAASPALARDLAGTIELHLYDGGYAGLLLQEDGAANLCLSVARARMARRAGGAARRRWSKEAPLLGRADRRRAPARLGGDRRRALWLAGAGRPSRAVYRVGDQAAVIASLAGDGIAVALASGAAAAQACLHGDGAGARAYQRAFARRARRPLGDRRGAAPHGRAPLRRRS